MLPVQQEQVRCTPVTSPSRRHWKITWMTKGMKQAHINAINDWLDGFILLLFGYSQIICGPACTWNSTLHHSPLKQASATWGDHLEANTCWSSTLPKDSYLETVENNPRVFYCLLRQVNKSYGLILRGKTIIYQWGVTSKRSSIIDCPLNGQALVQQTCITSDFIVVRKNHETKRSESVKHEGQEWGVMCLTAVFNLC